MQIKCETDFVTLSYVTFNSILLSGEQSNENDIMRPHYLLLYNTFNISFSNVECHVTITSQGLERDNAKDTQIKTTKKPPESQSIVKDPIQNRR